MSEFTDGWMGVVLVWVLFRYTKNCYLLCTTTLELSSSFFCPWDLDDWGDWVWAPVTFTTGFFRGAT